MAFTNQFALSVELTNLLPLRPAATKAAEVIMTLARELRGSGSDIVIEEDIANLMGRLRMAPNIATSFRNAVGKSGRLATLTRDISLTSGPGPTVSRSLVVQNDTVYLSTVIQCSFLLSIHDRASLASAIAYTFEKGIADQVTPSAGDIDGVLQAVEDQTNAYQWFAQLRAVALQLGIPEKYAHEPLPPAVFRGAIFVLPMCQTLRERRVEVVMGLIGLPAFVVWAHHIAGLNISVRMFNFKGALLRTIVFGNNNTEITVDCHPHYALEQGTITLLDTTDGTTLFNFTMDADNPGLEATPKLPIEGLGRKTLEAAWDACNPALTVESTPIPACVAETATLCVAFALNVARKLQMTRSSTEVWRKMLGERNDPRTQDVSDAYPFNASERQLQDAALLLFGEDVNVNVKDVQKLCSIYAKQPLHKIPPPLAVESAVELGHSEDGLWKYHFMPQVKLIVILLLALAHVEGLDQLRNPGFKINLEPLHGHPLSIYMESWDGNQQIFLTETAWFHAISLVMVGHNTDVDYAFCDQHALVSEQNWSVYYGTFGDADPVSTDGRRIYIKEGVPTRNGIRKHAIVDGTSNARDLGGSTQILTSGAIINAHGAVNAHFDSPLCGERGDKFVVSLRINSGNESTNKTRRTGFREMISGLWMVHHTKACAHPRSPDEQCELPANCQAVTGDGGKIATLAVTKLTVWLTANNKAARWAALLNIFAFLEMKVDPGKELLKTPDVVLRSKTTCALCAIKQASQHASCFLVL